MVNFKIVPEKDRQKYNQLVAHIMQSWEWGEFRKSLGTKLLRLGLYQKDHLSLAFQLTLHKIPFTNFFVGYLPKSPFPDKNLLEVLQTVGQEQNCAFIKIEPNVEKSGANFEIDQLLKPSPKPLFTKYNYILNLTYKEEEILKKMHPKFRYNIKVAQKHGVVVEERTDDEAFGIYLKLHFATTKRQGFHSHTPSYHQKVWTKMKEAGMARLLIAFYTPPNTGSKIPLASWMLFNFRETLYYPYGGSSEEHKNVMASNLLAWAAVKLGKRLKLKKFDLWGAADPGAGQNDPYYGFTQFKSGLGAELVKYIGTYDLVFNWPVYRAFTFIDKLTPLKLFLLNLVDQKNN